MIDDPDLTAKHDIPADACASSDTGLRGDDRIIADHHVVRDLHQIIDFDSPTNKGSAQGCAIDRCVGPYFHIISYFHDSDLRNFNPLITLFRVAKPIAADYDPGVQYDAVANSTTVTDNDIRVQNTILPHLNPLSQKHTWKKNTPGADPCALAHKDKRKHCNRRL